MLTSTGKSRACKFATWNTTSKASIYRVVPSFTSTPTVRNHCSHRRVIIRDRLIMVFHHHLIASITVVKSLSRIMKSYKNCNIDLLISWFITLEIFVAHHVFPSFFVSRNTDTSSIHAKVASSSRSNAASHLITIEIARERKSYHHFRSEGRTRKKKRVIQEKEEEEKEGC